MDENHLFKITDLANDVEKWASEQYTGYNYTIMRWQVIALAEATKSLIYCNRQLRLQVNFTRAALEEVEWHQDVDESNDACPWCHNQRVQGHRTDCTRQAALTFKTPTEVTDGRE